MPPVINKDKCIRCGQCVDVCPMDVFYGSKKGETPVVRYPDECWHAEACGLRCLWRRMRMPQRTMGSTPSSG